ESAVYQWSEVNLLSALSQSWSRKDKATLAGISMSEWRISHRSNPCSPGPTQMSYRGCSASEETCGKLKENETAPPRSTRCVAWYRSFPLLRERRSSLKIVATSRGSFEKFAWKVT